MVVSARLTTEGLRVFSFQLAHPSKEGSGLSRWLGEQVHGLRWEMCKTRAVSWRLLPPSGPVARLELAEACTREMRGPGSPPSPRPREPRPGLQGHLVGVGGLGEERNTAGYRVCSPIFGRQMRAPQRSPVQGLILNHQRPGKLRAACQAL